MKTIRLTKGFVALVDDEDFVNITKYKWRVCGERNNNPHAICSTIQNKNTKQKTFYMHRLIMKAERAQIVDHENRNGLDNQKHNLRFATHSQNMANRKSHKNSSSKYKGVSFHKRDNVFCSQIQHEKKVIHLGNFKNEIEAAIAYNDAATKYHGKFAILNII